MTRPPSPAPSQLPPVSASATYSRASLSTTATAPAPNTNNMSSYSLPLPPPPPPAAHAVLTKSDLAASQAAYTALLTTAKSYRLALAALSTAASAFGAALESCARLKEARADSLLPPPPPPPPQQQQQQQQQHHPYHPHADTACRPNPTASSDCTADALLAAAGVQHLVANHKQILAETVYRSFEVPLLHELDKWRRAVAYEESGYRAAVAARSGEIRRLERDGPPRPPRRRGGPHRARGPRDVAALRAHLVALTAKLDGLTALHGAHARALLRESQDTSVRIVEASCSLVRAEVDIFESLARKGWSGGGLDDILEKGRDLFAADGHGGDGGGGWADGAAGGGGGGGGVADDTAKLFSILPPRSILAGDAGSDDNLSADGAGRGRSPGSPGGLRHSRADSLGIASEPYQSLTGAFLSSTAAASPGELTAAAAAADAASIFSADFNAPRPPRMTRPFSPVPVRVAPEDVMGGSGSDGGLGDGGATDNEAPSAPATVRDRQPGAGGGGFEDEVAWDTASETEADERCGE